MILAEVLIDGDPFTYAQEAVVFLLLVGGALFLLTTVVLGQNPISSGNSQRKRFVPREDWPGAAGQTEVIPKGAQHRSGAKEKRRSLRRGGISVPVLVSHALAGGEPVQGLVLNRSRGGLRLSLPEKIEVGQLLTVRTLDFPEGLEPVEIRVRHCKQHSQGWHLGCEFVDELTWNVLLLFG
jgi:hypothetical protein